MTLNQHVLEETLEAFVMGKLQASEAEDIEDHLMLCDQCRSRLAETEQYILATKMAAASLKSHAVTPEFRQPLAKRFLSLLKPRQILAVAGALALTAILALSVARPKPVSYVDVPLATMRGGAASNIAKAGGRLRLKLDLQGLPSLASLHVSIVDAQGKPVFDTSVSPAGPALALVELTDSLSQGEYWVRIDDPAAQGRLLREYQLQIQ